MSTPYIDLHTHRDSLIALDEWRLQSLSLGQYVPQSLPHSLGLHPWYATDLTADAYATLAQRAQASPLIWAIGEAGLDKLCATSMDEQGHYFRLQVGLSERLGRPLVIHCVRAWSELLAIRAEMRPRVAWIVHGFRAKAGLAEQLLRQGLYLSFGAYYQEDSLSLAHEAGRLFLETDEAEVTIQSLYSRASHILGTTTDDLRQQIYQRLLGIAPTLGQYDLLVHHTPCHDLNSPLCD